MRTSRSGGKLTTTARACWSKKDKKKDKDTYFFIAPRDRARAISLRHALSVRHEICKACQRRGQRHLGIFRIVGVPFSYSQYHERHKQFD
jgi:hypothetical protein